MSKFSTRLYLTKGTTMSKISDAELCYLELTANHAPEELGTAATGRLIMLLLEENARLLDDQACVADLEERISDLECELGEVQADLSEAEREIEELEETIEDLQGQLDLAA